ncbi:uncharacterized protein isoform X1 [Rhodnius prolixus]|uniref:uncharacterized protein isoform X1 n=1 Tax=Rhodnius prolixus TaxID=13249 RepID=UPI003D18DC56
MMRLSLICPVFFCFVLDVFVGALPIAVTLDSGGSTVDTGLSDDTALMVEKVQESPDFESKVVELSHEILGLVDAVPWLTNAAGLGNEGIKTGQELWKKLLQYIKLFKENRIGFIFDLVGLGQEALYRLIQTGIRIAVNLVGARNNIVNSSVETVQVATQQMINGIESLTAIGNWFKNSITKIKNNLIEINNMLRFSQKDEVLIE